MTSTKEFDESKHPRDSEGQWSSKSGSNPMADDSLAEAHSYASDLTLVRGGVSLDKIRALKSRINVLQDVVQDEFTSKMPLERDSAIRRLDAAIHFVNYKMLHTNPRAHHEIKRNEVLNNIVKSFEATKRALPPIDRGPYK